MNQLNNIVVSYDLHLIKDYPRLYKAISNLGVAVRLCDSTWYVRSALDGVAVFNNLLAHVDNDDSLVVIDATNNFLRGIAHLEPEVSRAVEKLWQGGRLLSVA